MDKLIPFDYHGKEVRTVQKDGEPLFIAKDVCDILEIGNVTDAVNRLDDDERTLVSIEGASNGLPVNAITESGLYSLTLGSKKPEAKPFKRWVTHEVIPSIRKHGAYMTPEKIQEVLLNPDTIIQLATELKAEQERNKALSAKAEKDKPKVLFADSVATAKTTILIGELAKIIRQNGIDIGEKRLFQWLRLNGYLISRFGTDHNAPTQKSMDMKLFEVKETTINHSDGHVTVSKTTKVTGHGQQYFINKFLSAI